MSRIRQQGRSETTMLPTNEPSTLFAGLTLAGIGAMMQAYFGLRALQTRMVFAHLASAQLDSTSGQMRGLFATLATEPACLGHALADVWHHGLTTHLFIKLPLLSTPLVLLAEGAREGATALFKCIPEQDADKQLMTQGEANHFAWRRVLAFKVMAAVIEGLVLHPAHVAWFTSCVDSSLSWRHLLVNRVLRGREHFYSALPASVLSVMCVEFGDLLPALMIHGFVKTFFPNLLPHFRAMNPLGDAQAAAEIVYNTDNDILDEVADEENDGQQEAPGPWRIGACTAGAALVSVAMCAVNCLISFPVEHVYERMALMPHIYGRLGLLGVVKAIYEAEGVGGFFRGYLPFMLSSCSLCLLSVGEDAAWGLARIM